MFDDLPIVACSSGEGSNVAISLIRFSGFSSMALLEPFFRRKKTGPIEPRYSYFAELVHGEEKIDEVLFTFYQAPYSFTGENLLELTVHGNHLNVERIIKLFCDALGFRPAYGGEFSYRALKNKKLSLSQVEGLDLFLNANNLFSLKQGLSLLSGELQKEFSNLHKNYLSHRASVELSIDFSEDMGERKAQKELMDSFLLLKSTIFSLFERVSNELNMKSPEIVLFGPPNAGKSTFFNKILKKNRSIVSPERGTTRDYISESIKIEGNHYRMIDTAGIRKAKEGIEKEGIERSFSFLKTGFFKILLLNPAEDNQDFLEKIGFEKFDILLLTHKDQQEEFKDIYNDKLGDWSYRTNLLEEDLNLEKSIKDRIHKKYLKVQMEAPIQVGRQKESIREIYRSCLDYEKIILQEKDIAVISSELYLLGGEIEKLLGIVRVDDVLDHLFSNFCIGK